MEYYLVNGTITHLTYCECEHCSGHYKPAAKIKDRQVTAWDEVSALENVLGEIRDEYRDKYGYKRGDIDWDGINPPTAVLARDIDGDALLPIIPEKLLRHAKQVGVREYWVTSVLER